MSQLPQALTFVSQAGAGAGFTPDQCRRMELVIEELFTNTVHYGHPSIARPETGQSIRVAAVTTSAGLEIIYEDTAPPFDPTTAPDVSPEERALAHEVGGLGRVLVSALPNAVRYVREGERNKTIMRFDR